ncbi:hypothetical protein AALA13_16305 [Lachnospiraceae bacterium 50-23]
MDEKVKLALLKQDLGIFNGSKDDYLYHLLKQAEGRIQEEGIKKEMEGKQQAVYDGLHIQYAAYLFRKRAGTDTSMPRFLRYGLNNLLFSQKIRG